MQQPNIITKLSEHSKSDADILRGKYNLEFQVIAYRKITANEMKQSFHIWKSQRKKRGVPRNKVITVRTIIGFDD